MPNAAIVAAALTDHSTRTWGLYLDGFDVIKQPLNVANPYGVALESIEVQENGPGQVSSMTFTIDDPGKLVTVDAGMSVRYQDITNDHPDFLGWVQDWGYLSDFGQQGRSIEVTATGIENVLDWCVTTVALTFSAQTFLYAMLQAILAVSPGTSQLRATCDGASSQGTAADPIGIMGNAVNLDNAAAVIPLTIAAGTTIREAFAQAGAVCIQSRPSDAGFYLTVDFLSGVRAWENRPSTEPGGYSDILIPAVVRAEALDYRVDASGIIRGVYITGGNAAGSGLVSDGTGKIGPIATLSDSTILTGQVRDAVGLAYLAQYSLSVRGEFDLLDWSGGPSNVHVGSLAQITDASVGLSAQVFSVLSITKTYNAVRQDWHVNIGGFAPSFVALARRLTRNTRS